MDVLGGATMASGSRPGAGDRTPGASVAAESDGARSVAAESDGARSVAARADGASWIIATAVVTALTSTLVGVDPRLSHWFVLPTAICGVLLAIDVVDWLRRRLGLFDPQALVGLLGFHLFYLAPLLHVLLDWWPQRLIAPSDWRQAFGLMATLNLLGLISYRWLLIRGRPRPRGRHGADRLRIRLCESRFYLFSSLAVLVGLAAFGFEVAMFGGITGFVGIMADDREHLIGNGWLLIIAESFPLMLFTLIVVRWRAVLADRRFLLLVLLVVLTLVQLFVGGLRGSRNSTLWPVLLALVMIHLLVVRVSRKAVLGFAVFFISFMYIYGFYKSAGLEVTDIARGTRTVEEMSTKTGRDVPALLLGDFGRADIQAIILDRKLRGAGELAYGSTYLSGLLLPVPDALLPDRPQPKLYYGTEVLRGPGIYNFEERRWASNIYGLPGEAMLNFGPMAAPLAFLPFALVIRGARRLYRAATRGENLLPALIAPPLCLAAVLWVSSDVDNIVYFLVQRFAPLALVLLLSLSRSPNASSRPLAGPGRPIVDRSE